MFAVPVLVSRSSILTNPVYLYVEHCRCDQANSPAGRGGRAAECLGRGTGGPCRRRVGPRPGGQAPLATECEQGRLLCGTLLGRCTLMGLLARSQVDDKRLKFKEAENAVFADNASLQRASSAVPVKYLRGSFFTCFSHWRENGRT